MTNDLDRSGRRTRRAQQAEERAEAPFKRNFGVLAGPLTTPPAGPYRVQYRRTGASKAHNAATVAIVVANVVIELAFVVWLLAPSHHPEFDASPMLNAANMFVLCSVALVEGLRLINVVSLSLATLLARDPVPVHPDPKLRVAFLTTIVPGKEPLEMVRTTLQAARRIRFPGQLDVWLLDEGDAADVKAMCAEEGVHHFSRKGVGRYNEKRGAYKAKTKHGNYNAWIDRHGRRYDVFMSVDPDHVPVPEYAERMLGYFRDPDVAYVVGPQCYANVDNFVTRAAESQQFPFHSVVQRAANAYGAAMLVGTNNAVRIKALVQIGGLVDSITEDMTTGLAIHTSRNPTTGRKYTSVYTPDVVAVGEGPSSWSDYFSQQLRWSRGTFELLSGSFWLRLFRLRGLRPLHYMLITTFYPSMALGWILGAVNAVLYLALGASGIVVPPELWLALYVDATLFQLWVYVRNRRFNVSPFEPEGSPGVRGMVMSVLTSPIYASSLIATLLRRPARFVVTPKNKAGSVDSAWTFYRHFLWALALVAAIIAAFVQGFANVDVLLWPALALLITVTPVVLWWLDEPQPASVAKAKAKEAAPARGARPPVRPTAPASHPGIPLRPAGPPPAPRPARAPAPFPAPFPAAFPTPRSPLRPAQAGLPRSEAPDPGRRVPVPLQAGPGGRPVPAAAAPTVAVPPAPTGRVESETVQLRAVRRISAATARFAESPTTEMRTVTTRAVS